MIFKNRMKAALKQGTGGFWSHGFGNQESGNRGFVCPGRF